jgi:putative ABC transport system permease protein
METMVRDLRHALRDLVATPGFTIVVVLTLALGIGANVAVFSVVNGVLLRALPYEHAERLVAIWEVDTRMTPVEYRNPVSVGNFGDWREQRDVFEHMAAFTWWSDAIFSGRDGRESIRSGRVSADFFETLGVQPSIGRVFLPEEDQPARRHVTVLSHAFCQRRLGGEPNVIGRAVRLDEVDYTVVGVLPAGCDLLSAGVEAWTPMGLPASDFQNRKSHWMRVIARLKSGVTIERAQAQMTAVADGVRRAYPQWMTGYQVRVQSLREDMVGDARPALLVLLGAVGFVLLIATANVANLLLGRTVRRRREVAIRAALGAGRGRIIRQLLTESLVLSVVGGTLGAVLAKGGTGVLLALSPANLPRSREISVDATTLLFALGLSVATGLLFGLAPALQVSRVDLQSFLREGGRGASGTRRHRTPLVVAELALALVLLAGAGLMMRTMAQLAAAPPGIDPRNVLATTVSVPMTHYGKASQVSALFDRLMEEARQLPDVTSVGAAYVVPLGGTYSTHSFVIEGQGLPRDGEKLDFGLHPVSASYFETMRIPLVRGRRFTERDAGDAPPVVIVNEAMARRRWHDRDPVGQRIKFAKDPAAAEPWFEVVGVVGDVKQNGVDLDPPPAVYKPYGLNALPSLIGRMTVLVRTASDPLRLAPEMRNLVRRLDSQLLVANIATMEDIVAKTRAARRFVMVLLTLFAALALGLAAVGIYGVVSYAVGQRTQEIGIRMALGARPVSVLRLVIAQSMRPVWVGIGLGAACALALSRVMTSLLFGVTASDPATFAGVSILLAGVALFACYLPARRAVAIDVTETLRAE